MKNLIFIIGYLLFCSTVGLANSIFLVEDTLKVQHPYVGKKAIMINVDPFISFVGNLFNCNGNNQLRINTVGLVYRHYLPDSQVKRMTLDVNFNSNNYNIISNFNYPTNIFNGYTRSSSYFVGFTKGKEHHHLQKKFGIYYGYDYLAAINYSSVNDVYDYENGDIIAEEVRFSLFDRRSTLVNRNIGATIGIAGLFGVDYMISKRIFLNAEVRIPLQLSYNLHQRSRYEEIMVDFETKQLTTESLPNRPDLHLVTFNLSTSQFFQFRAGFVF